jgi:hypothetical protein
MSYNGTMNAEAILEENIRYDSGGKPLEVVIPYEKFIDFIESNGLDLTEEEKESIREAEADRRSGNTEAFTSLEEIKRELGCTG